MIFNYLSYKTYLSDLFNKKENRGIRKKLAEFLGCQAGFVSQVLTGSKSNFSLEHLERIAHFLKLEKNEYEYLLLLGQYEKAGSVNLQTFFKDQILEKQKKAGNIKEKIQKRGKNLTDKEKAIYYGNWAYMGVHMIVSIKEYQTRTTIRKHFNFSPDFTNQIVDFLIVADLIEEINNKLTIGKTRVHLESESPFISSLHQNWRHKAIQSLENQNDIDLHYSSVLVLSKKDVSKVRDLILKFIKDKEKILLPSREEEIVALNIDYFMI